MSLQPRPFRLTDELAVIRLWEKGGLTRPWNDPRKDICRKLTCQPEGFLVGELGNQIVATVMAGYDGHRGWINYLAVDPDYQRQGLGSQMMAVAEVYLGRANCPKINLQVRSSNSAVLAFYRHLGYAVDDVVSFGKRLEHDLPR